MFSRKGKEFLQVEKCHRGCWSNADTDYKVWRVWTASEHFVVVVGRLVWFGFFDNVIKLLLFSFARSLQ